MTSAAPTLEDANNMPDVIFNNTNGHQHKIDWTKNICIVDLSYLTYTRFFAVRVLYSKAFPEKSTPPDYNWTADTDFMNKFYSLFTKKLFAVCRQKQVPHTNIVFAVDCRHCDNWRVANTQSYKETRKESHAKNNFSNFDIFPYIRRAVIAPLQREYGNLVMKHNNLEADDMVALFVRAALERHQTNMHTYIMANDRDYVQICGTNIHLIDLNDKPISDLIFSENPGNVISGMDSRKFLLRKILCGDLSDNIAGCYFNKNYLIKYGLVCKRPHLKASDKILDVLLNNPESYQELIGLLGLAHSTICRSDISGDTIKISPEDMNTITTILKDDQFISNARLVDFANIPACYANEVMSWMQTVGI